MLGARRSGRTSYTPWAINGRTLREAEQLLGLSRTVKIHIDHLENAWGEYVGTISPHEIHLHNDMEHSNANHTLWHELIHAMQCERDFGGRPNAFNRHWLTYGIERDILNEDGEYLYDEGEYAAWLERYSAMPNEREAEALARKYGRTRKIITIS